MPSNYEKFLIFADRKPATMRLVLSLFFLGCIGPLFAQGGYFQQDVHYEIDVTLDDEQQKLRGKWAMSYTNNSPDTLHELYIHIWPNAYKHRQTALNQQFLRQGNTSLYFAEEDELGYIDSLHFYFDDHASPSSHLFIKLQKTEHEDVVRIMLPAPLEPGQSTTAYTEFVVQLPASFSRLGYIDQSYQLTQWYPKVAVYDRNGWHPMPYLDNGEFYSEFGTYDVRITLPDNYWVAATGELQTAAEVEHLRRKAVADAAMEYTSDTPAVYETPEFPPSSSSLKTLHFHAEQVHDFAWFADKRYLVRTDTLKLPSGKVIDAWAFFTQEDAQYWEEALLYIERATRYYSERVGEYPYPHVTAAQSMESAGGGMEYPMITLIGEVYSGFDLDEVITHEVGHNWFYGILGSNERDFPWMDEGVNSLIERAYLTEHYDYRYELDDWLQGRSLADLNELTYRSLAKRRLDQAPNTTSGEMWEPNYWLLAYDKPAAAFRQLEEYIGRDELDRAMQTYFQQWAFKHPQPYDMQLVFEQELEQDLSWLFEGFLASNDHQDYAIASVKTIGDSVRIELLNNGNVAAPVPVVVYQDERPVWEQWIAGSSDRTTILLPKMAFDRIQLDPDHLTLEVDRSNNQWNKSLLPKVERPEFRLLTGVRNDDRTSIFLSPLPLYNEYDGFAAGLGITNRGTLPQSLEWLLLPAYGFRSQSLVGGAGLRYRWWPKDQWWREARLQVDLRKASYRYYEPEELPLFYHRFSPSVQLFLQEHPMDQRTRRFQFRSIWSDRQRLSFSVDGDFEGTTSSSDWLHELSYLQCKRDVLSPYQFAIRLEQYSYRDVFDRAQDHLKLQAEANGRLLYQEGRSFHWRAFAGVFLHNSLGEGSFLGRTAFSLFDRGPNDYRFDDLYIGRSEQSGFLSRQVAMRDGAFRAPIQSSFPYGLSNSWAAAVNLSLDLPFTPAWLPLKPYVDAGLYERTFDVRETRFAWTGGLALEWLDGKIGLYLPLVGAEELMDFLAQNGGAGERIGFRISLQGLSPWNWMDSLLQ